MGFLQRYKDTKPLSQKDLKKLVAAQDKEQARKAVRRLENEASYNREWSRKTSGSSRRNHQQWARDDAQAAQKLRKRFGIR